MQKQKRAMWMWPALHVCHRVCNYFITSFCKNTGAHACVSNETEQNTWNKFAGAPSHQPVAPLIAVRFSAIYRCKPWRVVGLDSACTGAMTTWLSAIHATRLSSENDCRTAWRLSMSSWISFIQKDSFQRLRSPQISHQGASNIGLQWNLITSSFQSILLCVFLRWTA